MSNDDVHVVTIEDRAKEIIMATALNVCKHTFIEKNMTSSFPDLI